MNKGRARMSMLSAAAWTLPLAQARAADLTQDDVFRSINDSMHQGLDYGLLIPFFFCIAGVVAIVIYIRQYQKRQALPKTLNHQGKLVREMAKIAAIDPAEMRKYKLLADQMKCENPLTLMLCPSLMGRENTAGQGAASGPSPVSEGPDRNSP